MFRLFARHSYFDSKYAQKLKLRARQSGTSVQHLNDDLCVQKPAPQSPPQPPTGKSPKNSFAFSQIDLNILGEQLSISPGVPLVRQGNHADRVAESIAQGGGTYMTSDDMYRHLNMLENVVPKNNGVGARLWIDAIFFRVSAMLSGNKSMVLNIQQHIPSVDVFVPGRTHSLIIGGTIDYTALTTDPRGHKLFIQNSAFESLQQQNPIGLFVAKVKLDGLPLGRDTSQVVAAMYASAKYLLKGIVRGALTNGHEWIFLILSRNEDGNGGIYSQSPTMKIQVSDDYPRRVLHPGPDIIAGIISCWLHHSFNDLDENDWFSLLK